MHIPLYQALKAIKISDDQAAQVVSSLEDYMAKKIEDANRALVAQLKAQNWLIGFIGTILAIVGLAPVVAKLF
jgi:CHASE3 domain sensor protein